MDGLLAFVLLCVLLALWFFVARPVTLANHYYRQGLRGPGFIPLIGNVPELAKLRDKQHESFHETFAVWLARFGSPYVFYFGSSVRVVVSEPDLVREILSTHAYIFEKTTLIKNLLGPFLGKQSILLVGGDEHKRTRRLVSPAFHFSEIQDLVPLMVECVAEAADLCAAKLTAALARATKDGACASAPLSSAPSEAAWVEVDASALLTQVTLDIIGRSGEVC